MELVLASHNLHKIREFREMLKPLKNIDVLSLIDFPEYKLPEETGSTFVENALLKAEHAAKELNKWVIADDSGLVVPALEGRPGVYSKRYAGEDATCCENRVKLTKEMKDFTDLQRSAYFECSLALVSPEGFIKTATGIVEGTIATAEKGSSGFGYDPLFVKNDYDKTFAEIDETTKNKISHRRKAFEKLSGTLETLKG